MNQGKQVDHGADHLRHLPRPLPHRLRREAGRQQGGGEEGLRLQHQLQEVSHSMKKKTSSSYFQLSKEFLPRVLPRPAR